MTAPTPSDAAWTPPLLRDQLLAAEQDRDTQEAAQVARVDARHAQGDVVPPSDPDARPLPVVDPRAPVVCPGLPGHRCGRRVGPRMMYAVAAVDPGLTGGARHVCDGCTEWLHATDRIDRVELARQQGAPPAHLDVVRAQLAADDYATGLPPDLREARDARRAAQRGSMDAPPPAR